MFIQLLIVVAVIAVMAQAEVGRLTMNKKADSEFVRNIVGQAKEGLSTAHKLSDDGSVVIKDYQNSQYYGEIQCTCVSDEFHLCKIPPPYASSFYFFIV